MSRSGYSDDCDDTWGVIRWRGAVKSAIRGRRGQAFLREVLDALDAMQEKRLIAHALVRDGECCTMGAVALARGLEVSSIDPDDREEVASAFGIAEALAAEIAYENDDYWRPETPEARWERMRSWVAKRVSPSPPAGKRREGAS